MNHLILVGLVMAMSTGCATVIKGSTQDVEVKTTPAGLTARINTHECITPCTMKGVSRKSAEYIIIVRDGKENTYCLDKSFNFWSTIVGNVWNEIWLGLIVDSVSGASRDIEPVDINFENPGEIKLEPKEES